MTAWMDIEYGAKRNKSYGKEESFIHLWDIKQKVTKKETNSEMQTTVWWLPEGAGERDKFYGTLSEGIIN